MQRNDAITLVHAEKALIGYAALTGRIQELALASATAIIISDLIRDLQLFTCRMARLGGAA
jgi:hypothetical protein